MNRKSRMIIFLSLVLSIFLFINFRLCPEKSLPYIKGIYITSWTAASSSRMEHFINLIKATELNAVIIDMKEVDGIIAIGKIIPDPKELIEKLHQNNIYAIARIVVLKDMLLPRTKPNLALRNKSGELWRDYSGKTWLDPASKEVWDYHVEIAKEAIKVGFDEINFDYVRFPSDGDISKIVYPFWDGKTPKAEIIRKLFEHLNSKLRQFDVFLSVDLFGLTMVNKDDLNIGQLLENAIPYFDFICPMVYPSHYPSGFNRYNNPALYPYEIIKMNLKMGKERMVNSKAKLRPWLQDFNLGVRYDKRMIELEKQAVYDTDSYGWLMWNAASVYTEDALEIDKRYLD